MNGKNRMLPVAVMAVIIVIIAITSSARAEAQCNVIRVKNRTACDLVLCTTRIPSNPTCYVIPPFTETSITVPVNTPILGAVNACNELEPFLPATGCIWEIKLAPDCCANICFHNCVIEATPYDGPCSCE